MTKFPRKGVINLLNKLGIRDFDRKKQKYEKMSNEDLVLAIGHLDPEEEEDDVLKTISTLSQEEKTLLGLILVAQFEGYKGEKFTDYLAVED